MNIFTDTFHDSPVVSLTTHNPEWSAPDNGAYIHDAGGGQGIGAYFYNGHYEVIDTGLTSYIVVCSIDVAGIWASLNVLAGMLLRYQDPANHWFPWVRSGANKLQLWRKVNGSNGSGPMDEKSFVVPSSGIVTMTAQVSPSGISVAVNGGPTVSSTDATFSSATKVGITDGLGTASGSSVLFTGFSVDDGINPPSGGKGQNRRRKTMRRKNEANQFAVFEARDANGQLVDADPATITCYTSMDGGAPVVISSVAGGAAGRPLKLGAVTAKGYLRIPLTTGETNCDDFVDSAVCTVAGVEVTGDNDGTYPANFNATKIGDAGQVDANVVETDSSPVHNYQGTFAAATATDVTFPLNDVNGNQIPDDARYEWTVFELVGGAGAGQLLLTQTKTGARKFAYLAAATPDQPAANTKYQRLTTWRMQDGSSAGGGLINGVAILAKRTPGGTEGSITFVNGLGTVKVDPT